MSLLFSETSAFVQERFVGLGDKNSSTPFPHQRKVLAIPIFSFVFGLANSSV
jgi:hypothetical protein